MKLYGILEFSTKTPKKGPLEGAKHMNSAVRNLCESPNSPEMGPFNFQ